MKIGLAMMFIATLTACASSQERSDQYIQSLVTTCNQMGYVQATEEVACVKRLFYQAQARDAAQTDAMIRGMDQSRPIETNCRPDGLGGVRCTSRQSPGALILP